MIETLESALNYHQSGKIGRAITAYKKILRKNPNHGVILSYLGLACFEAKKFAEARGYLIRKLNKVGGSSEDFNLLGLIETEFDNSDEAQKAFTKAVEMAPEFFGAWNNLGNEFRKQGNLSKAIWCYKKAISGNSDHQIALENLAKSYFEIGDIKSAVPVFETLLSNSPSNGQFHAFLGELLSISDPEKADRHFQCARQRQPNNIQLTERYIDFLASQQRHQEALGLSNNLIASLADNSEARVQIHIKKARLLKQMGHFEDAEAAFREIVLIDRGKVSLWSDIASIKRFKRDDPDIAAIESCLSDASIDERQLSSVYFSLAKAYDDLEEFDQAFLHLLRANRLRREQLKYNVETDLAIMRKISQVFVDWPKFRTKIKGNLSTTPILIVGMPRSGTSLIEQILASHPAVKGGGENLYLRTIVENVSLNGTAAGYPDFIKQIPLEELNVWFSKLADGYLKNLKSQEASVSRITDKLPNNFLYLGIFTLAFPLAKIVHCQRNPVDTCFSCFQQEFDSQIPFTWDLVELGQYYQGYKKLMESWQSSFGNQIINIRYEDLITDQEGQTRELLSQCDLSWSEKCLEFHQNNRAILTASFKQVKQPIYQSSNQKWRNYEGHLKPLLKSLASATN